MHRLAQINMVLIGTTHPGNIGAAARAIKVMGLERLSLVNPENYPSPEARARASGADDVLSEAPVYGDLDGAIGDAQLVFGTSSRSRGMKIPMLDMRQAADKMSVAIKQNQQVAMLFGKERYGLTNEEIQRCHYLVKYPANPEYPSLNLAAAVQLAAYEIRMQCGDFVQGDKVPPLEKNPLQICNAEKMQSFYQHLFSTMEALGFLSHDNHASMTEKFRMMFNRMEIETHEMDMLRGFLSAINKNLKKWRQ